jgi:hypothetical protein
MHQPVLSNPPTSYSCRTAVKSDPAMYKSVLNLSLLGRPDRASKTRSISITCECMPIGMEKLKCTQIKSGFWKKGSVPRGHIHGTKSQSLGIQKPKRHPIVKELGNRTYCINPAVNRIKPEWPSPMCTRTQISDSQLQTRPADQVAWPNAARP